MRTLEAELRHMAADLDKGAVTATANRLRTLAQMIETEAMALVKIKTAQTRKQGTPYVTGDMVFLQREEGGGAA